MVEYDYKQICRRVLFPIFVLPGENIYYEDGLLIYNNLVLDDRNQQGKTLGIRRMQTPHKLYSLKKAALSFIDLINSKDKKFIDNKGLCFVYKKTRNCEVKSFKIRKKVPKDTYTTIWLHGVNCPFQLSRYPVGKDWAQILMLGSMPWKLLDVSENSLSTYIRKV